MVKRAEDNTKKLVLIVAAPTALHPPLISAFQKQPLLLLKLLGHSYLQFF